MMVSANAAIPDAGYVCVLKTKQAELDCLAGVSRDRFVALYESPNSARAAALATKWGAGSDVVWVQPLNVDGLPDAEWGNDVETALDFLRDGGVAAVPAVTLEETPEVIDSVNAAVAQDQRGIVLRLDAEELAVATQPAVTSDVDQFLQDYSVRPDETDIVVDVSLLRESVASRISITESALRVIPYLADWRNLVLAFSAFPTDMGDRMGKSTVGTFDRADRAAFISLQGRGLPRSAVYADFGVGSPMYPTSDAQWSPIPNIKYTDVDQWRVHRGATKTGPSPQYVQLATELAAASYFRGPGFSVGDQYIHALATGGGVGPGNATTWLRVALSHHVSHVLDRLSTHGEP